MRIQQAPAFLLLLLTSSMLPANSAFAQGSAPAVKLDFGDFSSATLTRKAWGALEAKNLEAVKAYTAKCQEMYSAQAVEMQKSLTTPATGEAAHAHWALNDVGTCCFILGKALEEKGQKKEALEPYRFLSEKLPYAQCFDPKGWFWKPADEAKVRVKALEFEAL